MVIIAQKNVLSLKIGNNLREIFKTRRLLNLSLAKVLNVLSTTLFSPTGLLNTLFVQTDGAAIYPYIVPFIKRCQLIFFPPEQQEPEEPESSTPSEDQLTPLSPLTPEQEEELGVFNRIFIIHSIAS